MKMNAGIVREMVAGRWSDYNRISNRPCFNFDGWHTHTTLKRCLYHDDDVDDDDDDDDDDDVDDDVDDHDDDDADGDDQGD